MAFTNDYSTTDLATLLDGAVSAADLADILNHHPNGAVVEIDPASTPPIQALTQIPDSNGNDPTIALLENGGETIDTYAFSNLHTVIQEFTPSSTELTLNGSGNLHVYLQPTSGGSYNIQDNMTNGKLVVSGSDANIELNVAYAGTAYGTNQTIVAKDGSNVVDIGQGTTDLTLKLGGGNNNVNIYGGVTTITGLQATDTIHFDQPLADATITKTTNAAGQHITEVVFSPTEAVTLVGWHDAATFSGDPNIHYI